MISRRALLSALPLLMTVPVHAQGFPNGQVRIIVPFPPGGATDVLGRVLAAGLQTAWGQTVISEYRPGAAGVIGTRQVIAAPADGHTLLMASTGAILALAGGQSGAFEVTRELAPVSLIAAPPYILVVNPNVPVRSAAELIAYAKANPGKLSFGSSGVGSASHLSGALFAQMTGSEMLHVPYRGTGPAVRSARRAHRPDVLAGAGGDAAHRGRHVARDRHDRSGTLGAVSGFSDGRRNGPAGLPVARLVRVVRAGRMFARHCSEDQRRCRPRAEPA